MNILKCDRCGTISEECKELEKWFQVVVCLSGPRPFREQWDLCPLCFQGFTTWLKIGGK